MSTEAKMPNPIHDDDISPQQVTSNTPALANNAMVFFCFFVFISVPNIANNENLKAIQNTHRYSVSLH